MGNYTYKDVDSLIPKHIRERVLKEWGDDSLEPGYDGSLHEAASVYICELLGQLKPLAGIANPEALPKLLEACRRHAERMEIDMVPAADVRAAMEADAEAGRAVFAAYRELMKEPTDGS